MMAAPSALIPLSDADLLAAIGTGDLDALGRLFDRYAHELERYLGRLGVSAGDVDDLVQATFLEVVRAAERFDSRYSARGWLFGVAVLMVRRHRRSVARALARIAAWSPTAREQAPPTPAELLEGDETTARLELALTQLSAKKREVFVLVTLEGMSGEETARVLRIPVKTVWTRLHHARLELRAALAEDER
jgi:RNA polymerase sigma factor (sigma-70 family)